MGDSKRSINLRFHHRGVFVKDPELRYKDEELAELWLPDRDKLHYMKIKRYVRTLSYTHKPKIYWLKPGYKLEDGLLLLNDDRLIFEIFRCCEHLESVDFYLKHDVDEPEELQFLEGLNVDIDELFERETEVDGGVYTGEMNPVVQANVDELEPDGVRSY